MKAKLLSIVLLMMLGFASAAIAQDFWEKLSGFGAYSFAFNADGHIFIGSDSGTVYRSIDDGSTFELLDVRPTAGSSDIIDQLAVNSQGVLFAYISTRGLHRSEDNGQTWPEIHSTDFGKDLVIDANDNIYLPQSSGPILFSTDGGDNWTTLPLASAHGLAVNAQGHLFAGTWNQGIFRSTDGGNTWVNVLFEGNVTSWKLAVTPDQKVHAMYASYYASDDGGDNWENRHPAFGWAGPMTTHGNDVYIGYLGGKIFKTSDAGLNWTELDTAGLKGSTLSNTFENQISLDPSGRIYAYGRVFLNPDLTGVYRSVQPITGIKDKGGLAPVDFSLHQNYPNPFNPSTTIKFSVPQTSYVSLKIYDALGREIAELVNEELQTGSYQVEFDGSNLSSGVYFYTLKAGKFLSTKKLVLMK